MASPKRKTSQKDIVTSSAKNPAEAEVIAMPVPETYPAERQSKTPPMRIGEILRRERERRGYDLQQIADYLCIRRSLLADLENSNYEKFPADAYVIGFLRSYADLIGISGQDAIEHYRQEMAGRRKKPELVLPTPVSEGRAPTAVIMGAAAFASLLIYIIWYAFSTTDRATVTTPPPLPSATIETPASPQAAATSPGNETLSPATSSGIAISAPAPTQQPAAASTKTATPPPVAAAAPVAVPASKPAHIIIKAYQASWVLVSNEKGQTVFDRVMQPGESWPVPDTPGLTLTTGNGAGVIVSLDGVDLPRLSSTTSHIVRNVPLETNALKALPKDFGQ